MPQSTGERLEISLDFPPVTMLVCVWQLRTTRTDSCPLWTDCSSVHCSRSFYRISHFNRILSAQPLAKYCHSLKIVHLLCKQQNKGLDFLFYVFPQNFQCKLQHICALLSLKIPPLMSIFQSTTHKRKHGSTSESLPTLLNSVWSHFPLRNIISCAVPLK